MSRRKPGSALFFACWLVLLASLPAWGRGPRGGAAPAKPPAPLSPAARAAQLVGEGVLALASRDFAAANRALAAAYQLQPSPDTLYQLGIVAWSEGQSLLAQDLLRRYLVDAGDPPSADKRSEAQRIIAQIPAERGEVWIAGRAGDFVLVDDRLLGQLPLPLPLLVSPGTHRLQLESAQGERRTKELSVVRGHSLVVRASDSGLSTAKLSRALLHVADLPADAAASEARLRRLGALLVAGDLAPATVPSIQRPPADCDLACTLRLAKEQEAEWALTLKPAASVDGKAGNLQLALIDVAVQEVAAQQSLTPAPATADGDEAELAAALPRLLQEARARGRGTLSLTSSPVGAEVRLGARVLGQTPLRSQHFAGPVELELSQPGYAPERRRVEVRDGQVTELAVPLSPRAVTSPAPPPPARLPRPAWRLGLGIGSITVGVGLVALGASALAVSGRCIESIAPPVQACPRFFDTAAIGGALVGTGAALGVAGALLVAWPGRKPVASARKGE